MFVYLQQHGNRTRNSTDTAKRLKTGNNLHLAESVERYKTINDHNDEMIRNKPTNSAQNSAIKKRRKVYSHANAIDNITDAHTYNQKQEQKMYP